MRSRSIAPRAELGETTFALADRIAAMPPFGLSLVKRAVNQCEDLMGMRPGMDSTFGLHHVATRTMPRPGPTRSQA